MQDSNVMQMLEQNLTLKVEGKKMIPKQHGKQEPKAVNDGRLIKEKKKSKKNPGRMGGCGGEVGQKEASSDLERHLLQVNLIYMHQADGNFGR